MVITGAGWSAYICGVLARHVTFKRMSREAFMVSAVDFICISWVRELTKPPAMLATQNLRLSRTSL